MELFKASNKIKAILINVIVLLLIQPYSAMAQNKIKASIGGDLVSSYLWRGQKLSGVSMQPTATISYKGFFINAWGSVSLNDEDLNEVDLALGYETDAFHIVLTDFWTDHHTGYFHYGSRNTDHSLNINLKYNFKILSLCWDTYFWGSDGINKDGDRAYSSYLEATVPFKISGIDFNAIVGATPWATSTYSSNGFEVCQVGLKASKKLKITDHFSLPVFSKITWSPNLEETYFMVGISL